MCKDVMGGFLQMLSVFLALYGLRQETQITFILSWGILNFCQAVVDVGSTSMHLINAVVMPRWPQIVAVVLAPCSELLAVKLAYELFREHERHGGMFVPLFGDDGLPFANYYGAGAAPAAVPAAAPTSFWESSAPAQHLVVAGGQDRNVSEILSGNFTLVSQNHGNPVYKKDVQVKGQDVMLYYWDGRDGHLVGWWFSPKVGADRDWAYNPSKDANPPGKGWKVPCDCPVDDTFAISYPKAAAAATSWLGWKKQTPGSLVVSGGEAAGIVGEILRGSYTLTDAENHEKPVYKKDFQVSGLDVRLYYWDDRSGPDSCGWRFSPTVGDDQSWAQNQSKDRTPPLTGWKVPCDGPVDTTFKISFPPGWEVAGTPGTAEALDVKPGDSVLAYWPESRQWFPAKIVTAVPGNQVTVSWDADGSQTTCDIRYIRKVAPAATTPVGGSWFSSLRGAAAAASPSQAPKALVVAGGLNEEAAHALRGSYRITEKNHGKPVYKKDVQVLGEDVMLYYWDDRDGLEQRGWWLSRTVGNQDPTKDFAYNPSKEHNPPSTGWKVPCEHPVDNSFTISYPEHAGSASAAG